VSAPADPLAPPPQRHRPWGWIAACVVLALFAAGFAFWAIGLQSDLDDQQDQAAQAQQAADDAGDAVDDLQRQLAELRDRLEQAIGDATPPDTGEPTPEPDGGGATPAPEAPTATPAAAEPTATP